MNLLYYFQTLENNPCNKLTHVSLVQMLQLFITITHSSIGLLVKEVIIGFCQIPGIPILTCSNQVYYNRHVSLFIGQVSLDAPLQNAPFPPPGYYCLPDLVVNGDVNTVMWSCPQGYFCPNGTGANHQPCPTGSYGNTTGLRAAIECTPCDPGHYCLCEYLVLYIYIS